MARQITDLNFGPPMRKLADAAIFRDKHAAAKPVAMHAAATALIFAAAAIAAIFGDSRAARPRHSAHDRLFAAPKHSYNRIFAQTTCRQSCPHENGRT